MPADQTPLESTAKGPSGGWKRVFRDHGWRILLRALLHGLMFFLVWLGGMAILSCLRGCAQVAEPFLEELHKPKPVTTYNSRVTH
jgi:hypothetical protein